MSKRRYHQTIVVVDGSPRGTARPGTAGGGSPLPLFCCCCCCTVAAGIPYGIPYGLRTLSLLNNTAVDYFHPVSVVLPAVKHDGSGLFLLLLSVVDNTRRGGPVPDGGPVRGPVAGGPVRVPYGGGSTTTTAAATTVVVPRKFSLFEYRRRRWLLLLLSRGPASFSFGGGGRRRISIFIVAQTAIEFVDEVQHGGGRRGVVLLMYRRQHGRGIVFGYWYGGGGGSLGGPVRDGWPDDGWMGGGGGAIHHSPGPMEDVGSPEHGQRPAQILFDRRRLSLRQGPVNQDRLVFVVHPGLEQIPHCFKGDVQDLGFRFGRQGVKAKPNIGRNLEIFHHTTNRQSERGKFIRQKTKPKPITNAELIE